MTKNRPKQRRKKNEKGQIRSLRLGVSHAFRIPSRPRIAHRFGRGSWATRPSSPCSADPAPLGPASAGGPSSCARSKRGGDEDSGPTKNWNGQIAIKKCQELSAPSGSTHHDGLISRKAQARVLKMRMGLRFALSWGMPAPWQAQWIYFRV